ncbi:MAG: aspartate ammonia-lyase [Armatimonadetes bacterium]|nr:aspartate ammonia-lyase [Armatimonadota bacterium]
MSYRIEKDSLGDVEVPEDAYWGSQAERSRRLFPITGLTEHPKMIEAYVTLKKACAQANDEFGLLDREKAQAIVAAADEILEDLRSRAGDADTTTPPPHPLPQGERETAPNTSPLPQGEGGWLNQFPVDVFHMGAGTSFHMNVNEVLANRAEEILGGRKGEYKLVNPNDHVNYGQSTNDTFPTAMRIMSRVMLTDLMKAVEELEEAFAEKGREFDLVLKSGRTHLQDAVPIRLGQEFAAYANATKRCRNWLHKAAHELQELGIGGSAVGTGLNTHPKYRFRVVELLADYTGLPFRPSDDMREAMQSQFCMSALGGAIRLLCLELTRITNDLRLLSSGPLVGLAEIVLPAVQPGSSIMPGKVNPSMAENLNIVLYQAMGQCHAIDMCVQAGQLELNVMMPGMAFSAQFMLQSLTNAINTFRKNCVEGITANEERCRHYAEVSPSLATALNPLIGYKKAAEVVKKALAEGKTIPEVVREMGLLDEETLQKALDPSKLTEPGIPGGG